MTDKPVQLFIDDLLRRKKLREASKNSDEATYLFHSLSESSIQALLSNSIMQNCAGGKHLVQQGDTPTHLFFIIKGGIKTVRYGADGDEATIRLLHSGETFMDAVIFMGGKSPINAVAIEDSSLLMIPAETVRRHVLQDAQFACNLLKIITRHYKNAMQQIDGIITKTPMERLGYYLLKQHLEQGSDSMDIALTFQKSMIANHLGMTPETFSRVLNRIKKMGIYVDQEKITLRDAYVLCHFCDPDTAHTCPRFNADECPLCNDNLKGYH
ncbi:MAG: cyclic nucleotide-binding domain-containing protein [Micavibrio aeruginosavorus]|uniref:Cyclic nucleotide-binding domain-containing protein n=1 Tax=Micavibrio aeruginosavorus TaxID=349221 RepID=A0A7T5R4D1_9BACT|nr:MAG: cyclic nucleotide-binding domain-containing protein [Micavibrio aeruginosavorus]